MQKDYLVPISVLIAGVLIAAAVVYDTGKNSANPSGESNQLNPPVNPQVSLELNSGDVILGDASAPVTIIEYGDFQCPFCGKFFSETESLIKENYVRAGKVKFIYRHFAFLGPESTAAAEAVECAKEQKKFWEYHDALYNAEILDGQERNENLNPDLFQSIAAKLNMNSTSFSLCLNSHRYVEKVKQDYAGGLAAGVNSTPTIFINGTKIAGAMPYANFKALIDNFLK